MTDFGKIVVSCALSVLAHVSLFTALALMPEPVAVPVKPEAQPLEVTFEAAPEFIAATPEIVEAHADALRTQLDPELLKKAEQAPENPTAIAAHDSQATPPRAAAATPAPTPLPDSTALTLQPASSPKPQEEETGVDALGHYGKAVGNAIGVRWEFYRKSHKDLPVGEVRIQFSIDAQGRVFAIRVLTPGANPASVAFAERAVKEAKIPSIPPERLAQVPGGCIETTYTFTIY